MKMKAICSAQMFGSLRNKGVATQRTLLFKNEKILFIYCIMCMNRRREYGARKSVTMVHSELTQGYPRQTNSKYNVATIISRTGAAIYTSVVLA
jgi:hypothetical protein